MSFDAAFLESAHGHCFGNVPEMRGSEWACCIACARSFPAMLAVENVEQKGRGHSTVLCPVCGFDAVIGDSSGYPVCEPAFIDAMNGTHFNEPLDSDKAWKELLDADNR
jgi:hypothetical protein